MTARSCIKLIIPFLFHVLPQEVSAQGVEPVASPSFQIPEGGLKVGDQIPEELWNLPLQVVNHPEGKETITLNDYRGKLIILDFWATWCTACIAAMPKAHELKNQFGDKIATILVTDQESEKINEFISTNKALIKLNDFSVVNDNQLMQAFPHKLLPHYVWINPAGKIKFFSSSDRLSAESCLNILEGNTLEGMSKIDIDAEKPLFLDSNLPVSNLTHYAFLYKGYYSGLPSGIRYRRYNNAVRGLAITNAPLLMLYEAAVYKLFEQLGEKYNTKRRILEVSDPQVIQLNESSEFKDIYETNNLYNTDVVVPLEFKDSLYSIVLDELNKYTGYFGRVEKRKIKCLVLKFHGDYNSLKSTGGKRENTLFFRTPAKLTNNPVSYLVTRLNDIAYFKYPIVDETGIKDHVDLQFSGNTEFASIEDDLKKYGFVLEEEDRTVAVFVLSDNGTPNTAKRSVKKLKY